MPEHVLYPRLLLVLALVCCSSGVQTPSGKVLQMVWKAPWAHQPCFYSHLFPASVKVRCPLCSLLRAVLQVYIMEQRCTTCAASELGVSSQVSLYQSNSRKRDLYRCSHPFIFSMKSLVRKTSTLCAWETRKIPHDHHLLDKTSTSPQPRYPRSLTPCC